MGKLKRSLKRRYAVKNREKDIDQIYEEQQKDGNAMKTEDVKMEGDNEDVVVEVNEENEHLPGFGKFFCTTCAKHFINAQSLSEHGKSKHHKKRIKELQKVPYLGPEQKIDNGKPVERPEDAAILEKRKKRKLDNSVES